MAGCAMFDNLVLHESHQPGQKVTYCIPLMKAGSQRNLDHKKNMWVVIQLFSEHTYSKSVLITSIPYVYAQCMYVHTKQRTTYAMAKLHSIHVHTHL